MVRDYTQDDILNLEIKYSGDPVVLDMLDTLKLRYSGGPTTRGFVSPADMKAT